MKCNSCKYAIMDYETYYGTTRKEWFATECTKDMDMDESDCEEYEEVRDGYYME